MTAIDPIIHSEAHPEGPQHAEPSTAPDTYLDYAVRNYEKLAETPPPMPMDVHIAALIGAGDEARGNTVAIGRLTITADRLADAVERLEPILADHTATMKAFLASQQQGVRFAVEEAESAIEQLPVPEST